MNLQRWEKFKFLFISRKFIQLLKNVNEIIVEQNILKYAYFDGFRCLGRFEIDDIFVIQTRSKHDITRSSCNIQL